MNELRAILWSATSKGLTIAFEPGGHNADGRPLLQCNLTRRDAEDKPVFIYGLTYDHKSFDDQAMLQKLRRFVEACQT